MSTTRLPNYKLYDFKIWNEIVEDDEDDIEYSKNPANDSTMSIQMFGINEEGKSASIIVRDFTPFFYVKVGDAWTQSNKKEFLRYLKAILKSKGIHNEDAISEYEFTQQETFYGFDNNKKHKFILLKFSNMVVYNIIKELWYRKTTIKGVQTRVVIQEGIPFKTDKIQLYEAHIPPILRFLHINEISPSGWVQLNKFQVPTKKTTTCDYEYIVKFKEIEALNTKEARVPYKIMSMDIESSSSHGDFPVPIKQYKKLATNMQDYCDNTLQEITSELLINIIKAAFGYNLLSGIEKVYIKEPKKTNTIPKITTFINNWLKIGIAPQQEIIKEGKINSYFEKVKKKNTYDENIYDPDYEGKPTRKSGNDENADWENDIINNDIDDNIDDIDSDNDEEYYEEYDDDEITNIDDENIEDKFNNNNDNSESIINIITTSHISRDLKINLLMESMDKIFPSIKGDEVTFIGSTFKIYGSTEPYLNHCIVLGECEDSKESNTIIECCNTEREVLLAWTELMARENPDIVIGYNIFGFDYNFMFKRSQECNCVKEFIKLSRNKDELCATQDYKTREYEINKSSITISTGTYDLGIILMPGRLQVDMLNWFRRTAQHSSNKLDFIGSHYIGDVATHFDLIDKESAAITRVKTLNMTGLQPGRYIHFKEITHTSNYYKNGDKFKVIAVNNAEGWFEICGHEVPSAPTIRWGLAKDDVSPRDIFKLSGEGPASKCIVANYCNQDCNIVHYLFDKVDVVTDLVEMSRLCSIPMSMLIMRGQGIKLTGYVAKECRRRGMLIPVNQKGNAADGYEGALVLDPKCKAYMDNPVAVGDYGSLYPSSMIADNLCPNSKVWSKSYNLTGEFIGSTGEMVNGEFIYDNLPGFDYINRQFDTYSYIKKTPNAKAIKVKSGHRICRFVQLPNNVKSIVPSILQELLAARKNIRKQIPKQTDPFYKNVLEQRQLATKATANSLYGQLGSKTSTFYEPDIAAATTSTGQILLLYAKEVLETCYADTTVETSQGTIYTNAEYVYGDTDSVFFTFNLANAVTREPILGQQALELTIEIAQEACALVTKFLKPPHNFEYEKTFMFLCLLSKKRYVAIKYEFDASIGKGKRSENGIVLKRRDNAPIVKDVYGGVIDIFMSGANTVTAVDFVHKYLNELAEEKTDINKLIISKSLSSSYKNPKQIAHKVLSDRMYARDPGNKPCSGDRIPFVYIVNPTKGALQGDKIESPPFIAENSSTVKIDYSFYITNQLMKPLIQLFGLMLEQVLREQGVKSKLKNYLNKMK